MIDIKLWLNILDNIDGLKILYNESSDLWDIVYPQVKTIDRLHVEYNILEQEYFAPDEGGVKPPLSVLLAMIDDINEKSIVCNIPLREGKIKSEKMWEIYFMIIYSSFFDKARQDPEIELINHDVRRIYENFKNTPIRTIGHWTSSGAVWITPNE